MTEEYGPTLHIFEQIGRSTKEIIVMNNKIIAEREELLDCNLKEYPWLRSDAKVTYYNRKTFFEFLKEKDLLHVWLIWKMELQT